jgi:hypothetical protein
MSIAPLRSPTEVHLLGEKAIHVHISDCDGKVHGDLPPGRGIVKFSPYLQAIKQLSMEGVVSIELEYSPDPARIVEWVEEAYRETGRLHLRDLPFGIIQYRLQSLGEIEGKARRPACIHELDSDQVAQVHPVFVAEGDEFHPHEVFQRHQFKAPGIFRFAKFRRGVDGIGNRLFSRPKDMHDIANFRIGTIEKDIHRRRLPKGSHPAMHEAGCRQSLDGTGHVVATEENIHIARVPHGGFIHP